MNQEPFISKESSCQLKILRGVKVATRGSHGDQTISLISAISLTRLFIGTLRARRKGRKLLITSLSEQIASLLVALAAPNPSRYRLYIDCTQPNHHGDAIKINLSHKRLRRSHRAFCRQCVRRQTHQITPPNQHPLLRSHHAYQSRLNPHFGQ